MLVGFYFIGFLKVNKKIKKNKMDIYSDWGEYLMTIFLVIGLVLSVAIQNQTTSLIIIFLFGLLFGRFWFKKKQSLRYMLSLVVCSFASGYILGKLFGNTGPILVIFFLGMIISYYIHKKGWIQSVDY